MDGLLFVGYVVGAFVMAAAHIRYCVTESDYAWDMDDPEDILVLGVMTMCLAFLWPIAVVIGTMLAVIKKAYEKVENNA